MNMRTKIIESFGVTIQESEFITRKEDVIIHAIFHVNSCDDLFVGQLQRLSDSFSAYLKDKPAFEVKFGRCFVSDSTNQEQLYCGGLLSKYNFSFIQQPPLDGSKIALWVYLKKQVSESPYEEIWTAGLISSHGSSYDQTKTILTDYEQSLKNIGCSITDQCVRTWFFVRDVDTQYKGMVDARRENFELEGMTQETHYISSTGIGGLPASVPALIQMDAFAVKGLNPEQQRYLYAKTHLNSTYEYGVTFERGTAVDYDDHTELFISGTASIDNNGNVLFLGDIVRQTERMLENVSELLKEGGAQLSDIMQIIVYLRDIADFKTVQSIFAERFKGKTPVVFTYAPVCRPTWLIEMECIAMVDRS